MRFPARADDQIVKSRVVCVAPAVVELHIVPRDQGAGGRGLEGKVVEATEVGARREDAWFQEGFYDFREVAVAVGGRVEEFAAEASEEWF